MVGETVPRASRDWRRRLSMLVGISVLAPAFLFIAYAVQSHNRTFAEFEDRLARRAAMLSEYVARVFDTQVAVLDLLTDRLDHMPAESMGDFLAARVAQDGMLSAIKVLDRQGTVLAASLPIQGINYADREYFQGAMVSAELFVGGPIQTRTTRETVLELSRRWRGGAVVVGVRARFFEDMFAAAMGNDAEGGLVALLRADGTQLARQPAPAQPLLPSSVEPGLMQHISHAQSGLYLGVVPQTTREGLFAFNKVGRYPVWVITGLDVRAITRHWLEELIPHAVLTMLVSGLLVATAFGAIRRERAAAAAEQHLQRAVALRTAEAMDAMSARKEAMDAAERANRAKSHFLASASHDLRQPIQGVRLFLDVLESRLTERLDRKVLANAVRALEGAESLLSTLLDVSTLEAGMICIEPRPLALDQVMADLVEEFYGQAEARGLSFRYVPCRQLVETDPVLLARMLRNLLTNAVRYTERGRILLGCRRDGANLRVEVWDTGQGIPDDKLDAVFDDFVQVGNPERDRAKGLGLGLAVVRRMAALLCHDLGVRSVLGRGTVFWIGLPVVAYPPE